MKRWRRKVVLARQVRAVVIKGARFVSEQRWRLALECGHIEARPRTRAPSPAAVDCATCRKAAA